MRQRMMLLLAAVPALASCAASSRQAEVSSAPPSSPAEARLELGQLEQQIGRDRLALGLAPRQEQQAGDSAGASSAAPAEAVTEPHAPAPEPPQPVKAPAEPDQQRIGLASKSGESDDSEQADEAEKTARPVCSKPCKIQRAICRAAERICVLAGYLGDAAAAGRCRRARGDCQEARKTTGGCGDCR